MQGEGKRRSEWNNLLLRDVIAPIYAALVARARDVSELAMLVDRSHPRERDVPSLFIYFLYLVSASGAGTKQSFFFVSCFFCRVCFVCFD